MRNGLESLKKRGVLLKEGQTLKSLYEERVPLYEKYADIVVDEEGKDLEASLQALLETLQTGVIKLTVDCYYSRNASR